LIRSGSFSLSVSTPWADGDFDPLTLTSENVFALLDAAQQLDAPGLKRFLATYIASNYLRRCAPTDPLGDLIPAVDQSAVLQAQENAEHVPFMQISK
jgi:hypothetical protein